MKTHIKFIAAAATAVLVGCKKDNAPEVNKAAESAAPDRGQELMQKIKDFAAMREAYKSGPLHYSPTYHSPYNQCELIDRNLYPNSLSSVEIDFVTELVHTARVRYCGVNWINQNVQD